MVNGSVSPHPTHSENDCDVLASRYDDDNDDTSLSSSSHPCQDNSNNRVDGKVIRKSRNERRIDITRMEQWHELEWIDFTENDITYPNDINWFFVEKSMVWTDPEAVSYFIFHISYFIFHISYFIFRLLRNSIVWIWGNTSPWKTVALPRNLLPILVSKISTYTNEYVRLKCVVTIACEESLEAISNRICHVVQSSAANNCGFGWQSPGNGECILFESCKRVEGRETGGISDNGSFTWRSGETVLRWF